jgi:hypothetical protein
MSVNLPSAERFKTLLEHTVPEEALPVIWLDEIGCQRRRSPSTFTANCSKRCARASEVAQY